MERPIRVDEIQGLWTYLASIDWTDPWFRYLLLFHVICCLTTIVIRKKSNIQFIYFGFLIVMVYLSEYINEWAAKNYKSFSRQQYFDSNGLFISTVFSTPILINCLIMVIMWLLNMSKLMSEVRYVKHRSKRKNESEPLQTSENRTDKVGKREKGD
ncbi:transmembrane protein 18-like isoform X1 [Mytilus trossulus]|uniref:transmembrane protein 18-like isoform X1 n=1 Tax=Mytilus trossulus TaxID=6551 RepID=UPI003005F9F7